MPTTEELQTELASLRAELQQMRSALTETQDAPSPERSFSRRSLLRAAPVAALGAGIAALAASPAAAADGQPLLLGQDNDATGPTGLTGSFGVAGSFEVAGNVDGSINGESGSTAMTSNVTGPGTGLVVEAVDGSYVERFVGVTVIEPGIGVAVSTQTGAALQATSQGNVLDLTSTAAAATVDAVTIGYAGTSRALYAESTSTTNINGTITGVNDGTGTGVWGEARGAGVGVVGYGGSKGRGAQLSGAVAPLRMVPATAASHPTTGKAGDFFVDSSARLWYCQKASSGSVAATWKQLA